MYSAEDNPIAKLQQRRWRSVIATIYSSRIFVSLYMKVISKKQIMRTLSYIAVDIHDGDSKDDHLPPLGVDQKTLTEVVREKNLETLSDFGGVKQIAASLETDEKNGITANEADLAHRINVFGANRYPKPPNKSFLSLVFEAFKDTTIIILLVCAVLSLGFGIKQHDIADGWYDGGSIIIALFLAVAVSAGFNFHGCDETTTSSENQSTMITT